MATKENVALPSLFIFLAVFFFIFEWVKKRVVLDSDSRRETRRSLQNPLWLPSQM